jgi:hypothetical protein
MRSRQASDVEYLTLSEAELSVPFISSYRAFDKRNLLR